MSSINKWLAADVQGLKNRDRLLSVLYSLSIATKEQLATVTGWPDYKVKNLMQELRNQTPIPEYHRKQQALLSQLKQDGKNPDHMELQKLELKVTKDAARLAKGRDAWVTILQPDEKGGANYYTLGNDGIIWAKQIRREYVKPHAKQTVKSQTAHYFGINEMLCRLRRRGEIEADWQSEGEIMQDIHHWWNIQHTKKRIPYRPDCLLQIGDDRYYGEFDTGSESNGRLRRRFNNCLELYNNLDDPQRKRLPNEIIWTCPSDRRKQRIEEIAKEILEEYIAKHGHSIRVPQSYCFVAGDDTKFVLGEIGAEPFWYGT